MGFFGRVGRETKWGGKEIQGGIEDDQEGDDDGLRYFDAVDSSEDVDAVGCKDGDHGHVDVVEVGEVEERRYRGVRKEIGAKWSWDYDGGHPEVDKVDYQEGDCGEGWDQDFMTPAEVEEVVNDAEKSY